MRSKRMSSSAKTTNEATNLPTELKAEQALGLIGMGLMQKMGQEDLSAWNWTLESSESKTNLLNLKQRLELISLALETGAPLSTTEITQLLGAKPGSSKTQRGGLLAERISRNVWKLSKAEKGNSYWRN